jgi:hypothetical protein
LTPRGAVFVTVARVGDLECHVDDAARDRPGPTPAYAASGV